MVRKIGKYISRRRLLSKAQRKPKARGGSIPIAPRAHHDDDLKNVADKTQSTHVAEEILRHAMVKKGSFYNFPLYRPPSHEPLDLMALAHQIHADHFHETLTHSDKRVSRGGDFGGGILADMGGHTEALGRAIAQHGHTVAHYGEAIAHKLAPVFGDDRQSVDALGSAIGGVSKGVWDVAGKAVSAGGYALRKLDSVF